MQEDNGADRILAVDPAKKKAENRRVVECFRRCFSTHDGQIVLNQMLIDLKYYSECNTDTDMALNNYAKFMLKERLQIDNRMKITEAIYSARNEKIE